MLVYFNFRPTPIYTYFNLSQFVSAGISGWVGPVAGASELAKLACLYRGLYPSPI
jgi:hypothetical protein